MSKFAWRSGPPAPPSEYQSRSWDVNPALRKGKLSEGDKGFVSDLDKHMKPYKKDTTLYRAQPKDTIKHGSTEKAYTSAHEDPEVAYDYLPAEAGKDSKGTIYKIHVPKGTKGTSMKPYPESMDPREHILARGAKFERLGEETHPRNPDVKIVSVRVK